MTESSFRTTPSTIPLTDLSLAIRAAEAGLAEAPAANYDGAQFTVQRWQLVLLLAAAKEFRSTQLFLDNCLIELLDGAVSE